MFWCALVLSTGLPVIALLMEGKYSFAALAIAGNLLQPAWAAGFWGAPGPPAGPGRPGRRADN